MPRRRAYPRPGSAVVMVVAWIVFNLACLGMLAFVPFDLVLSVYGLPVALIQAAACFILLCWAKELNHVSWRELLPFRRVPPAAWVPVVAATLSMHFAISSATDLVSEKAGFLSQAAWFETLVSEWLSLFLSYALPFSLGALAEELFFRGVILRGLLAYQKRLLAVTFSAVLFAAVHLNLQQLPIAFAGGLLFGWLYARGGSLWPSIVAHIVNNLAALSSPFALLALRNVVDLSPPALLLTVLGVSVCALAASLWWCHRTLPDAATSLAANPTTSPPERATAPAAP